MARCCLGGLLGLALALPALGQSQEPALLREKKPAVFQVSLPADADLELNGLRTRATGETRRFESPPLETGSSYTYALKAAWRGKTVTQAVTIRPGLVAAVDLRRAFDAATVPTGSFS